MQNSKTINSRNSNLHNNVHVYLIIASLVVGLLLRIWNLGSESLRLDEAQSIWQASHSIEFIKEYMLKNVHLPLHNTLLHFWIEFFGTSEPAVRLLAVIPGMITLPFLYLLSKEILGKKGALITLILASVSPFWVWYSREIRMYTLLTLVTTISYLFFVKILKTGRFRYFIFYTAANLIGIYTHYFFFLVLLVQVLFFFYFWKRQWTEGNNINVNKKKLLAGFIISAVFTFAAFSPWVNALYNSYGSGTLAPVLPKPTTFNLVLSFFEFVFGFLPVNFMGVLISFWPLITLFGFIFLTKRRSPFSKGFYLVILGTFLPISLVYFVSIVYKPMYLTRYLMPATPMFFIFISWYIVELRGKVKFLFILSYLVIIALAIHVQFTSTENPARENYRDAVEYVTVNATPRDIVIVSPPYIIYPFQYYYNGNTRVSTMPIWNKKKGGIPQTTIERVQNDTETLRRGHQRMFLVLTSGLEGSDLVKMYFDNSFTKLDKQQFSKDVWIHVYQGEYY